LNLLETQNQNWRLQQVLPFVMTLFKRLAILAAPDQALPSSMLGGLEKLEIYYIPE
jgi:hypothetical protein